MHSESDIFYDMSTWGSDIECHILVRPQCCRTMDLGGEADFSQGMGHILITSEHIFVRRRYRPLSKRQSSLLLRSHSSISVYCRCVRELSPQADLPFYQDPRLVMPDRSFYSFYIVHRAAISGKAKSCAHACLDVGD